VILEDGHLLRIFIGERDRYMARPLYEWILHKAHQEGLAGATVIRGMMGYGPGSRIASSKLLRLSQDLPVIIEIVDARAKLERFLEVIQDAIPQGLVTLEKAQVCLYRGRE